MVPEAEDSAGGAQWQHGGAEAAAGSGEVPEPPSPPQVYWRRSVVRGPLAGDVQNTADGEGNDTRKVQIW